jgi:hypothetical protein
MSLHRSAVLEGRQEIADLLLRHGARRDDAMRSDDDRFMAACFRLGRDEAAAIARRRPDLRQLSASLCHAARLDRADVVSLLLDLGVEHPQRLFQRRGRAQRHRRRGASAQRTERGQHGAPAAVDPRGLGPPRP